MSKFNFNDWKDRNIAMHCKTSKEAYEFCEAMNDNGLTWVDGESYLEYDCWDDYKEETCYVFNNGVHCDIASAVKHDYEILKWENYSENSFTKSHLKNFDICVLRNNKVCIVSIDLSSLICYDGCYISLSLFDKNLKYEPKDELDIIEVYRPAHPYQCTCRNDLYVDGRLMYNREEIE